MQNDQSYSCHHHHHQHSYALVVLKLQEAGLGGAPSREQAQPRTTTLLSGGIPSPSCTCDGTLSIPLLQQAGLPWLQSPRDRTQLLTWIGFLGLPKQITTY